VKTGAVIVAAGMLSRMGDFKPMLQIGAISMVKRIIANFQRAAIFPIVVVTGFRGAELEKHIAKTGVICVRNEDFASSEMFDSAKLGFSYIVDKCDRTFFSPVDIPLFTLNTVMRLMESRASVVKPVCSGASGHPILLSCDILPALIAVESDKGLKKAIQDCCRRIETVDVSDEGVLQDADTPDDYKKLVDQHNRQLLRPSIEISLMRENKLFDAGGAHLLHMIEYTGTVKGACEKMQISYSKAWGMLSELEENLGFSLIERQPGGEYGGSSQLTSAGRELLNRYETFMEKVRRFADDCFKECFGEDA
jgi:molybdenum cofactor cytidylyltransferase